MHEFEYHSPGTLAEACQLLKKYNDSARVLAGGTDLLPKMYQKQLEPAHIVNIKKIPGLDKIVFNEKKGLTLGSLVKFNDLIYSEIVQENYPILVEVSKILASHQIRNLATIGGNLCNAAPSADSAPILIAMDSTLTITSPKNKTRTLSLEQFFTGPGTTALKPGELLNRIQIPPIKPNTGIAYIKHTTRKALEIAVVGVAGLLQLDKGSDKCTDAKVVVAACAPTPIRIPAAEELLIGKNVTDRNLNAAADAAASVVKPISDVRGSEDYRREMVKIQCKRVLEGAHSRAKKSKRIKSAEVES